MYKEYMHGEFNLSGRMYQNQRNSAKNRDMDLPDYTIKEFRAWLFSQPNWRDLYESYIDSNMDKYKIPSVDRKDCYNSYTLGNLQLMSWEEHEMKGDCNLKNMIPICSYTFLGKLIRCYSSLNEAADLTRCSRPNITKVCKGLRRSTKGYIFKYKEK